MTIPAIKQKHLAQIPVQERKHLGKIPAGPNAPNGAPSRNASGGDAPSSRTGATRGIVATLCVIGFVSFIPGVLAQGLTGIEDFERCDVFDLPDSGDCTTSLYSYSSQGTGSVQVVSAPAVGARSVRIDGTNAVAPMIVNFDTDSTTQICDNAGGNYAAEFHIQLNALPAAGERFSFGITNGGAGNTFGNLNGGGYAYFNVNDAGVLEVVAKRVGGTQVSTTFSAITMTAGSFYNFQIECTTTSVVVFRDMDALESAQLTATGGTGWGNIGIYRFYLGQESTGDTTGRIFLDNLQFTAPPTPGPVFCSAPTEGNFGYDYVEQVVYDDSLDNGIGGLDDGFVFAGDNGDNHYLGKAFPDGTIALSTRAGIESQIADAGESSIFWIAYTTGTATLSEGATGDGGGDMVVSGDGDDTGNFADHIQARFVESGDNWLITIQYNVGGAGRTQISSSVTHGDPDNPRLYIFEVNSGPSALDPHPMIGVAGSYDGFPALPARTARVLLGDGTIVLTRDLPAAMYDFVWKDQWFVGAGDSGLSVSETFLDENEVEGANNNESTCVYDLTGTAIPGGECYGSCGTAPTSTQPSESTTTTTTGGGTGFDNAPAWLWPTVFTFLGAMVIAAILALLVGRAEMALFGILAFVALIISIVAWGMPLYIPLLFLILPAIAIVIWKGPWSN